MIKGKNMAERNIDKLTDALTAPLGDLISSVAKGVADAQQALDLQTITSLKELYGSGQGVQEELRRLGYQPTWYKIPEVEAEIIMSLTIGERENIDVDQSVKLYAAPIDASYSNRYDYDIKGASKLKFKIVPVPPSPQAEEIKVVPFLEQKNIQEAIDLLNLLEVPFEFEDPEIDPSNLNTLLNIVNTTPEAGTVLKDGEKVKLVTNTRALSEVEEVKILPNLKNKNAGDAMALLRSLEISFAFQDPNLDIENVNPNINIEGTEPPAGTILERGQEVLLITLPVS